MRHMSQKLIWCSIRCKVAAEFSGAGTAVLILQSRQRLYHSISSARRSVQILSQSRRYSLLFSMYLTAPQVTAKNTENMIASHHHSQSLGVIDLKQSIVIS